MKRIILPVLILLAIWACQPRTKAPSVSNKPVVTVSILPQKFFIEQIAGDFYEINVMVSPGADPHDYEPTARQMTRLARSEVYFYAGYLGFEQAWLEKLAAAAPQVPFSSNSTGIDLLNSAHQHAGTSQHEDHSDGIDPHIWTSPHNVKIMCQTMFEVLISKHPEKKEFFQDNLNRFLARIDELDTQIRAQTDSSKRKSFIVFHPALGYFARDYDLDQHTIEYEGKTPSPAQMKRIIDLIRTEGIKTIFIQSQFETAKAEAIARETGSEIVPIDPLAYNWFDEMVALSHKLQIALNQ